MAAVGTGAQSSYPLASLYVGDLAPEVTEAMLYEKFSQSGPVLSIRVCRDLVTRRSLGYAYVNFQNSNDAERALDTMNFDSIKNRPMRIMWSQRDPSLRKSGVGNIFIKNLDKSIDNKQLLDTFNQFGNILSCKIVKDKEKGDVSKGYGFVHFESEEAALAAIEQVDGMLLNDRKVFVGRFKSRSDRVKEVGEKNKQYTNVYIKNLPDDFTEQDLTELTTKYGECLSVKLMVCEKSGRSKNFGFASYANHEEALIAVTAIHDTEIRGKRVYAGRAQKKAERLADLKSSYEKRKHERQQKYAGVNLYVKNLDDSVTDEMLREAFESHGTITSAKVMLDEKSDQSKGFGFVCYSTPEEATKAVSEMNGRIVGTKPLYVALAQRKEDRKAHLQAQYLQRAGNANPMRTIQAQYGGYGGYNQPMVNNMYMYQTPRGFTPLNNPRFVQNARYSMPVRHHMQRVPGMGQVRGLNAQMYPNTPMIMRQPGHLGMQQMGGGVRNTLPLGQMGVMNPGSSGTFKYTNHARNLPNQYESQIPMPMANGQASIPGAMEGGMLPDDQNNLGDKKELTAQMLAQAIPSEQKQMLGEKIYPIVQSEVGEQQAGKVTGMLLEIENTELLCLLETPELMKKRITEAVKVLKEHAEGHNREDGMNPIEAN